MSIPRPKEIIARAIQKRAHLIDSTTTNLIRLIDGTGDHLPGHYLESYGHAWLISTSAPQLNPAIEEALASYNKTLYWKRLDQHQKQSPTHLSGPETPEYFTGLENNLTAQLSFHSGYSQGIFIDQRHNRATLQQLAQPGQTVLNTFSYTGFFSIAAAASGATTTTLDLSQVYLDWARENFRLNNLNPDDHYFCKGDTFHWLQRFAKQGRTFDYIILDPPTFSRDHKGKVFRVEKDYGQLFKLALACSHPGTKILCCTNYRGITQSQFMAQLKGAHLKPAKMPEDFPESPYLKSIWATV